MKQVFKNRRFLLATTLCAGLYLRAFGDGIPEPGLILYGVVRSTEGGADRRVAAGVLEWTFAPADGGTALLFRTSLTNLNDQFSYVLEVPCETELPGLTASAGVLRLKAPPVQYTRRQVTLDGKPLSIVGAAPQTITISSATRGLVERVDLSTDQVADPYAAWSQRFFGRPDVPEQDDPDQDGLSNGREFLAGTNPTDPNSVFEILRVSPLATGGARIEWSSSPGKAYRIRRSTTLSTNPSQYIQVGGRVVAEGPLQSFEDLFQETGKTFFYLIEIEPQN